MEETCHKSMTNLSHNFVSSTAYHRGKSNSQWLEVIGTDYISRCKPNTIQSQPINVFFLLIKIKRIFVFLRKLTFYRSSANT